MTARTSPSPVSQTSAPRVIVTPKISEDRDAWIYRYKVCVEVTVGGNQSSSDEPDARRFITRQSAEIYARWIAWTIALEFEQWKGLLHTNFEITVATTRRTYEPATVTRGPQQPTGRRVHQLRPHHRQQSC